MNALSRPCPERELLLHGLADGELDAANALSIEEHLRNCSGCSAVFSEIIQQKEFLSKPQLRLKAPAMLRSRVLEAIAARNRSEEEVQTIASARSRRRSWFPQAAFAFSGLALAASLLLFISAQQPESGLGDEIEAAHVRSLLASHLTDVASSDQHTVKPWFLGKLDFSPPVVELAQKDFPLVGGRLDYIRGRVVAAIVYKRRGHVINLFVWPDGKTQGFPETLDGYHILSWTGHGFTFAAVSDLNLQELRDFQHALNESLT